MRFRSTLLFSTLLLTPIIVNASPRTRRGPTAQHFNVKKSKVLAPQRAIDTERTTQIQSALIARGYLSGEPTGIWTPETQAALRKLQEDNGWQTKFVPDSRAIIKLGLGAGPTEGAAVASSPESAVQAAPDVEPAIPAQQ